ncbi:hypothetical protein [Nostoc sp.]
MIPTVIAPHTPGASPKGRRYANKSGIARPTHWLPLIPSLQAGRGDKA